MINRIRLNISNFIRNHKDKIKDLGRKLIMVAMGVFIATIMLSAFSNINEEVESEEEKLNVYKPTQTVIKGSDVSKEEFEQDSTFVNRFLEHCNNKDIEAAYDMVSDECKKEKYPTIEDFKEFYYDFVFDQKRDFNLQAWISDSDYIVYKIRYSNNMLATGTYDENDVYQDYITLNRKNNTEKISIGSLVDVEECNIVTQTKEIEATVISKKTYISDEEYEIYVKNITDKTILLDDLKSSFKVWLVSGKNKFFPYINQLYITNLTIKPGETQRIRIKFIKNLSSDNKSQEIQFLNVIKDYEAYKQNKEEYTDVTQIEIKVVK